MQWSLALLKGLHCATVRARFGGWPRAVARIVPLPPLDPLRNQLQVLGPGGELGRQDDVPARVFVPPHPLPLALQVDQDVVAATRESADQEEVRRPGVVVVPELDVQRAVPDL